jgi:hypothetical protein
MDGHPWPEILLADRSPFQMAVYADWLTEAGDPLAEGIRWLADEGKRPTVFTAVPMIAWNIRNSGPSHLPKQITEQLEKPIRHVGPRSKSSDVYYACLVDAARAYSASLHPEAAAVERAAREAAKQAAKKPKRPRRR